MIPALYRTLARIRSLFRKSELDRALQEELAQHIECATDENIRRGMTREEARRQALVRMGSRDAAMELQREARGFLLVESLLQDARYAARLLQRNRIFALTAAVSLAIGIGADATIFTMANALLFSPAVGVEDPGRVVDISRTEQGRFGVHELSYPDYLEIRRRVTMLDGVYLNEPMPRAMSMSTADGTESVFGISVSPNYFSVLGVRAAAGRLLDRDARGSGALAVLSYDFWQRRFKKDPSVVGRTVQINGQAYSIAGVAAEGFHGTMILAADLWIPVGSTPMDSMRLTRRDVGWGLIGGRLKPGVSVSQAAAELNVIGAGLAADYPAENRGAGLKLSIASPIPATLVLPVAGIFTLLLIFVSLVLVIACANVAGVLLSRAAARRREIAVRLAIGVGRARLVRQLLTETVMIFLLGGAAGLLLSRGLTSLVLRQLPRGDVPFQLSVGMDLRIVVFTVGLSLGAAVLCGLVPALQASRGDVVSALKDDAQGLSARSRLQNAFVVAQVAFSIVLVIAAGLFLGALQRLSSLDLGYDPSGVELSTIDLALAHYANAPAAAFVRELSDRIHAIPGAQSSISVLLPTSAGRIVFGLREKGSAASPEPQRSFNANGNVIDYGYFATMRIPLLKGRDFTAADDSSGQQVAIVSQGAARDLFPGEDAIGRYLPAKIGDTFGAGTAPVMIVGIAGDTKALNGPRQTVSMIYRPLRQQYFSALTIAVRSTGGANRNGDIRALLWSMNPNLPILKTQTLEEAVAAETVSRRIAAAMTGSLGIVGLLLASLGIYGVTAYAVTRRTREIGIRMALGARRSEVVRMMLGEGMLLVALGSATGLILSLIADGLLAGTVFNIPPLDVVTFAGTVVLFAIVGLLACFVPVRRATKIDPMSALRYE